MNSNDIRERCKAIAAVKDDDERAHALEDSLYHDFVRFVATAPGGWALLAPPDAATYTDIAYTDIAHLARLLLRTEEIEFGRWCA